MLYNIRIFGEPMTNHEKSENMPLENELKKISMQAFSQNPDLVLLMGDNSNFKEPTAAILTGMVNYGNLPEERCEVEITNFYDNENGECFIYLVDDSCFYLSNKGLFNVEDNETRMSENDLFMFIDLISDTEWMSVDIQDFYGKHLDN